MHECVHYVFDCVLILCMNCACFNLVYDFVCVHFVYDCVCVHFVYDCVCMFILCMNCFHLVYDCVGSFCELIVLAFILCMIVCVSSSPGIT